MRGRWAGWLAIAAGCAAALAGVAGGATPTDPQAVHASYAALNLPAAWDLSTGAPEIVVAVVDTGVDPSHPDLAGAVDAGYDFVDADDDALDLPGFGHGTAVAGVVAARANNGLGGIGTCFGCHVMPLRVIGLDGIARNVDTAAAIDYAVDHGAAVVNASINGERFSQRLREAIVRARAAGVLVVAAAGNEANAEPRYPAAFPEAISVTSATTDGRLATFASYGEWVKFAAPDCAPVTALGGGSDVACATSVSTPLVAGVVGLLRARAPFASADELEAALASTARPVPGTRYGLVDAAAALTTLGTPTARLAPVVLGRPAMREVLEAWSGVWSRAPLAVAYQWERCREESCSPIAGATTPRYTVTALDAGHGLRVAVSALGASVGGLGHDRRGRRESGGARPPLHQRGAQGRRPARGEPRHLGRHSPRVLAAVAAVPPGCVCLRGRRRPLPSATARSRPPVASAGARDERARQHRGAQRADPRRALALAGCVGSDTGRQRALESRTSAVSHAGRPLCGTIVTGSARIRDDRLSV